MPLVEVRSLFVPIAECTSHASTCHAGLQVNPNKAQRLLAAAFLNFVIEQRTLLNRVSFGKERSEDSCDQGPNKHESCIMREATQDVSDIVNLEADNEMEVARGVAPLLRACNRTL